MKAARIPAPGIALGRYPERQARETSSLPAQWLRSGLSRWRQRKLGRYQRFVSRVRELERGYVHESPEMLRDLALTLRAQLACDGFVDTRLAQTFAVVAVLCKRKLGTELYDTQLMAARIMLDGQLAEMATGEGKTLAAAVTTATAALAGVPVHVVTANDYLVTRDAETLRPLYQALGLTVGAVTAKTDTPARHVAYACDITYCTAKELVFDYLRDQILGPRRSELEQRAAHISAANTPQKILRGLCMAVIDEADSILIDEARVPLILSRALPGGNASPFRHAWRLATQLDPVRHFLLDASTRRAHLTAAGRNHLRMIAASDPFKWRTARHCEDTVTLAMSAGHLLRRGRDYLVQDGRVHIIDETTGRTAPGRSWSQGLHQLVEIKEDCAPSAQIVPMTQITYQRFFPRYLRLCGMSGTLLESRHELLKIYGQDVIHVPLRRPTRRTMLPARVFTDIDAQWVAVVDQARNLRQKGRPVLIGTDSVLDSEVLSQHLTAAGLKHAVLNACQDRHEACVIAAAGALGSVTVATNMAGRGTDIVLGASSMKNGGLHVICCQQNAARRIDRQLLGRSARQGDPGSAEVFISLDGPLLARGWTARLLKRFARSGNVRYAWIGLLALRLAQRSAEHRQKLEREALLRRDQELGKWLAFSGTED